jgi:hypothetical protein
VIGWQVDDDEDGQREGAEQADEHDPRALDDGAA